MNALYRLGLLLAWAILVLAPQTGIAQSGPALWLPAAPPAAQHRTSQSNSARWFTLDAGQLVARLATAPPETRPADAITLELPYPDGSLHRFALTQVPVLAPALAAQYPQIQTYAGYSRDEPTTTVRLENSPAGLHAQVLDPSGPVSIEAAPGASNRYQTHLDAPVGFDCRALPIPGVARRTTTGLVPPPPAPYGTQLRTLRLALSATGEYTQALGGGTVAGTVASMASLVNDMNAVYERDLTVRLQLVANTNLLVSTNPATDPYDNSNPAALMESNQAVVDAAIGMANYDLGHVLGYYNGGYSGIAYVGVVCYGSYKARGASTGASPGLMTTVLTHEIGHQLGSNHTFNGDRGNCGGGNRSADMAYEPGAGNSIMSYDERCAPDNVGPGIKFFHAASLGAIRLTLNCGGLAPTGNRPPIVTAPPTNAYTIPIGTPFTLTGTGTDPDGEPLTYSWEQLDLGSTTSLAAASTDPNGPLFRSFAPVSSPSRTFPNLSSLLANTASPGENLPLVPRALNFRLTARDNHAGAGGVAGVNTALTVAAAGPFVVTAPRQPVSVPPGSAYTLTWSVLGTDQPPINCANVQVLFSTDGGQTFPWVLLASTPNNGVAQVQFPAVRTTTGRLKIQPLNNIFFAINTGNISLVGPLPVELTAFTAQAHDNAAHLAWTTASETNNTGFAAEVSPDGLHFHRLGWIASKGTGANAYAFDDPALPFYPNSTVYYRLRQLDADGTEHFSPIRPVVASRLAGLRVWPNPARSMVEVAGLAPGQLVRLLDLAGRVLLTATLPTDGPLRLPLPAGLHPGMYVVSGGGQARRLAVE
jgi:hypothetical protein